MKLKKDSCRFKSNTRELKLLLPLLSNLTDDVITNPETIELCNRINYLLTLELNKSQTDLNLSKRQVNDPSLAIQTINFLGDHELTNKQRAYDDYFGVERCMGGTDVLLVAINQVILTLKEEFKQDNTLKTEDLHSLFLGLHSLLETLCDD